MDETFKAKIRTLRLILAMTSQLLVLSSLESFAQDAGKVLIAEKRNSSKHISFNVGQTASYKTGKSKLFQKGVIHEITDSTISFSNKKLGIEVVPFKDLKELKALKPGRKGGGTTLIVTGLAGVVLGAFVIGISESHIGSGNAGAAALIPVGGAILLIAGILVLQPDAANTATLKTETTQKLVEEKKQAVLADTVEHYKKWKVGAFAGYAFQSGAGGALVNLEPGVRLNDDVALGLRVETASLKIAEQHIAGNPGGSIPGSSGTTSVTANIQFYLGDGDGEFRPFIGFGMGPYFFSNPTINKIGFYPRLGFDAGHFTLIMDYNLISKISGVVDPNPCSDPVNFNNWVATGTPCGNVHFYEQNYSYFAVRLGYMFGGGKK